MVSVITNYAAFQAFLAAHPTCVIDMYTSWCGPCKMLAPAFARMAETYGEKGIAFAKVDIEKVEEVATIFSVSNIPTILYFKGGKLQNRVIGANPALIEDAVKNLL